MFMDDVVVCIDGDIRVVMMDGVIVLCGDLYLFLWQLFVLNQDFGLFVDVDKMYFYSVFGGEKIFDFMVVFQGNMVFDVFEFGDQG